MKNYNTLINKTEDFFIDFNKEITKGMNKVNTKFIVEMTNGITQTNSIILSNIARTKKDKPNIKKTVDRYTRLLDSCESNILPTLEANYVDMVKPYINNKKLYFVDGGDIVKGQYTKFENKCKVMDGSNSHAHAYGYNLMDICTIDNSYQPISLVSEVVSTNDITETSINLYWAKLIKQVVDNYGDGTIVADRGFDSSIFMEKTLELGCNFIIRAKTNLRDICYVNGEKRSMSQLIKSSKGQYVINRTISEKQYKLRVTSHQITIKSNDAKSLKDKVLTLVIVKGFADGTNQQDKDPSMVLLTSKIAVGKNAVIDIVDSYVARWKIEENFKYKKQQFNLEKIMVRRYKEFRH